VFVCVCVCVSDQRDFTDTEPDRIYHDFTLYAHCLQSVWRLRWIVLLLAVFWLCLLIQCVCVCV